MLRLHGFAFSNYHNVVKLALLEKRLEFEEVAVYPGAGPKYRPDYLAMSPLGKIPCLETEHGFISESRCILEYLDAAYPAAAPALFPAEPYQRGKHDELYQILELYLELTARRLLPAFFTETKVHDSLAREVKETTAKGVAALEKLACFEPFLSGPHLRAVDIAAGMHLPTVASICQRTLGYDPLAALPALAAYQERMEQRPHMARIRREAKADGPAFTAHIKTLFGVGPASRSES